jgi:hypothetical protein
LRFEAFLDVLFFEPAAFATFLEPAVVLDAVRPRALLPARDFVAAAFGDLAIRDSLDPALGEAKQGLLCC